VATKIKLMRLGKMRAPYYRIVVADARTKRDGRVIETIGKYHPKENPSFIEVDADRAAYWLGVGAQATEPVERILKVTGDWQRFKGEAAPAPMLVAEPKPDKRAAFEAASRAGIEGATGAATTPKKKAAPKATASDDSAPAGHAAPPADQPTTAEPAPAADADAPAADAPAADAKATDAAAAEPAKAADAKATDAKATDATATDATATDAAAAEPADAPAAADAKATDAAPAGE
jgi:small subunit ribosomal protein S16